MLESIRHKRHASLEEENIVCLVAEGKFQVDDEDAKGPFQTDEEILLHATEDLPHSHGYPLLRSSDNHLEVVLFHP